MRAHASSVENEEEMFEDDPIEYIRRDLESSTGILLCDIHSSNADGDNVEGDTRRQAATEFTRALMENFENEVTDIIKGYITAFLSVYLNRHRPEIPTDRSPQEYASNPSEKWKSKDTAIYLLTSIASRGSTQQVRSRVPRVISC